jgi:hypothetical protein
LPIFYFLFCLFIFVNLREGEKNLKKQIQKKKKKEIGRTGRTRWTTMLFAMAGSGSK